MRIAEAQSPSDDIDESDAEYKHDGDPGNQSGTEQDTPDPADA